MTPESRERAHEELGLYHDKISNLLDEVFSEVDRATSKHSRMCSPHHGYAVIKEELDELWDEIKANNGGSELARYEAIQIAAVAVRYVLDLCEDAAND